MQAEVPLRLEYNIGLVAQAAENLTRYNVQGVAAGPLRTLFVFALVLSNESSQQALLESVCAGH